MVEPNKLQMTIWRTRLVCWIPKATNAHSKYATFTVFPRLQKLHKLASLFHLYIRTKTIVFYVNGSDQNGTQNHPDTRAVY